MALLGTVSRALGSLGTGLEILDSLFQKQTIITNSRDKDDSVVINVTKVEQLNLEVQISDKPVANEGVVADYVARLPTVLTLDCVISNRSLDLGKDPLEFFVQAGLSQVPGVAAAINQASSLAGNFIDLGKDEIDRKLETLRRWQTFAVPVEVLGLKLDPAKINPLPETFNFLIQRIGPSASLETGDNAGLTLILKEFLNIQQPLEGLRRASTLTDAITGSLNLPNPF